MTLARGNPLSLLFSFSLSSSFSLCHVLSLSFMCSLFLASCCRNPYACSSLSHSFYPCFSPSMYVSSIGRVSALCPHSLFHTIGLSPDSCWLYLPKGQLCEISIWRSVEIRYLKRQPCIPNKCLWASPPKGGKRATPPCPSPTERSNKFPSRIART